MAQSLFVRPLTDEEAKELTVRSQSPNREEARRAELLLLSAGNRTSPEIAGMLGFHPSNVKKWIRKFNQEGLPAIELRKRGPREARRPSFTRDQVEKLLDLASTHPSNLGLGFKRWTAQKLATAAAEKGIVERISHVTVQQILNRNSERLQSGRANGGIAPPMDAPDNGLQSPENLEDAGAVTAGRKALEESQFGRAAELLHGALVQEPLSVEKEAEIRSLLSQALEELGKYDESHSVVEKYEDARVYSSLPPMFKARVKLRLGWAHSGLKNHPKAIAALNDAKKLFLELEDSRRLCEARLALGRVYIGLNEFRIARDHLLEAAAYVPRPNERELIARVYIQLGYADFHEGAFKSSKQNWLKASELAEGCKNLNTLGMVFLNLGVGSDDDDPAERQECGRLTQRAIECLGEGGHKGYLVLAYNNLGEILRFSGQWAEAKGALEKAIEIALRYDQTGHEATGRQTIAELLCAMGKYREAEEHLSRCIELAEDSDKWLEAYATRILGAVHLGRGQVDNALAGFRHSLRLSSSLGDMHGIILAEVALAEAHLNQGGVEQAREYVEVAQGRYRDDKSQSLFVSGMLQRIAGEVETARRQFAKAKQHLTQSLSIFTAMANPYEAARSHYSMGRLLVCAGDAKSAKEHLEEARGSFRTLGAVPWLELASTAIEASERPFSLDNGSDLETMRAAGHQELDQLDSRMTPSHGRSFVEPSNGATLTGGGALVMQRLIEASTSRDVLLQELAAVICETFAADIAMVCHEGESGRFEPVASEGLTITEASNLCAELDPSFLDYGSCRQGACIIQLRSLKSNNDAGRGSSPLLLYVSSRTQFDQERVLPLIKQVELGLEICALRAAASAASLRSGPETRVREVMPGFIVSSPLMHDVMERIHKIRTSDVTVLITGESGTGKELVARAIHAESARASAVFLPFNCTATPRDLIESQLFGHRRGAFTGAIGNYSGMVRAAEGGTLFLDEIGDLALEVQPKLMRFLQEGEIQPLGETRPLSVDVRVLAATNSDLERAVDEGRFREDLFHRLNIIRIHVPPLRERRDEVPALASFFLNHFASRSGREGLAFTQDAIDALMEYTWPGNVRQLRNEIERVTAYASDSPLVSSDDLSPEVRGFGRGMPIRETRLGNSSAAGTVVGRPPYVQREVSADRELDLSRRNSTHSHLPNGRGREAEAAADLPKLRDAVAELETRLIQQALARNRNNISRTAEQLGLSRRGLRLKLGQLGIERTGE
ncbi:MAG TPA: sigma 54-interacting transcriptional regulator [Blastocatellia bacterium]